MSSKTVVCFICLIFFYIYLIAELNKINSMLVTCVFLYIIDPGNSTLVERNLLIETINKLIGKTSIFFAIYFARLSCVCT